MSAKAIIIGGSVVVAAIAAIAAYMFETRRYLTNNPNVHANEFNVHPDETCPICLENMDLEGRSCALLDCGHFLHQKCLEDMNKLKTRLQTNKCPVCRTPFRFP